MSGKADSGHRKRTRGPLVFRRGRFENLRFVLEGNRRGLALISALSLVTAFGEAFFLAAVVQSIATISGGKSEVPLDVGPLSARIDVQLLLVLAVSAAVVRGVCTAAVAMYGPYLTGRSRARDRGRLFGAYLRADWATQSADKTGRLLQTLSGAVNDANSIMSVATQALPALLTLLVLVGVALFLNPLVTLALLAVAVVIAVALRPLSQRAYRNSRSDAAGRNAIASHVAGVIAAGAEVKVAGSREGVLGIALQHIDDAEHHFGRAHGLKRLVSVTGQSLAFLLAAVGLLLVTVSGSDIDFATVGTITVLLFRGAGLAQQVQTATSQFGAIAPFIEQVRTTVEHYESQLQTFGHEPFPERFDLTLLGLEYTYPGTNRAAVAVDEATFHQGSSVAVVGPSGSGKSTLIQLMLRLRAPSQGEVLIGGRAAADISDEAFTDRVAFVPQAPHLVPGSIKDNITFFRPDIPLDRVHDAARKANIHEAITIMADGYDTVIDAHVDTLSGGQKQRLALARALVSDPAILILDEPTSALDASNEEAVLGTLRELRGEATVVMITHKASTYETCDIVLRLEDGRLTQQGGHHRQW